MKYDHSYLRSIQSTFGSRLYVRRKLYSIEYTAGSTSKNIDLIMDVVGLLKDPENR